MKRPGYQRCRSWWQVLRQGWHNLPTCVDKKTYDCLRDFRAGVEGNISELKRAYKMANATWKGHEGFLGQRLGLQADLHPGAFDILKRRLTLDGSCQR